MHNHKSTGIASGLEYRPGYRVGGRVGYKDGTDPLDFEYLPDYNPELDMSIPLELQDDVQNKLDLYNKLTEGRGKAAEESVGYSTIFPKLKGDPKGYGIEGIDFGGLGIGGDELYGKPGGTEDVYPGPKEVQISPELKRFLDSMSEDPSQKGTPILDKMKEGIDADIKKYYEDKETNLSEQRAQDPGPEGRPSDFYGEQGSDGELNIINENSIDGVIGDIFKSTKAQDESRAELDAMLKGLRESQDAEIKQLREKQSQDKNKLAILNMVAAANDPNLQVGQSRVAAAAGSLTESARDKAAFRDDIAQKDLELKHAREEGDLTMQYQRAEKDIAFQQGLETMEYEKMLAKKYGTNTATIKNITFLTNNRKLLGLEDDADFQEALLKYIGANNVMTETDLSQFLLEQGTINPNGVREMLGGEPRFEDDEETPTPITAEEISQLLEMRDLMQIPFKDGGRVGYQEGGDVESMNNDVPMVMTYDQLRAKLPDFITDDIVKLIAYSPPAFKDFASIETQQDVEEFNDKYDVNLVLPNMDQIDYAMPSDNVDDTSTGQVPVPPAVAANPQMPMQTGTGQLTPTETALLDPTEQAIRMRNR